ncbi:MAG: arylsulfatase [Synoicihabitans sp.]
MRKIAPFLFALLPFLLSISARATTETPPNVILILTDDQGIGDLGAHGNPWIKTPHIDKFYTDAVRLTDFHVSPVCTPTRGALMTGRYPIHNGAWATYKGRDSLSPDNRTLADLFRANGYRTGLFGKWHLGDAYPVRATDSGFDLAVQHKSGGVGELSDYWGNNYFDDTYFVNNEPRQFEGYCTDIWFDEAMTFMRENRDRPFFAYIPTNAPHGPFYVAEKYAEPYRHLEGDKIVNAEFYGMVTNIDENFGRLESFLTEAGLADNTILIYMTDNGSGGGRNHAGTLGHNHGFRGRKGQRTEGGHRVPFFIHWADGKVSGGWDIDDVTAHVDLLPTLAGLCNLDVPASWDNLDGVDVSPLLRREKDHLEDRTVFIHSNQDWRPPADLNPACIIRGKWRLVNGTELYDIAADRHQDHNLAKKHPDVMAALVRDNAAFIARAKKNSEYYEFPVSIIGNDAQPVVKLTIQHAIGEDAGFWKCEQVAAGLKSRNNKHAIEVERAGRYRISLRRWPTECPGPIQGIPSENPKNLFDYQTITPELARIEIANQIIEIPIARDDEAAEFEVNLDAGKTILTNDFIEDGKAFGVYYTYITRLD